MKTKKTFLFILFFIFIFLVFYCFFEIFLAKNKNSALFEIKKGEGFLEIGKRLEKEGFIKNRYCFYLYTFLTNQWRHLQTGQYKFENLSLREIVKKIKEGKIELERVTIIEGMRLAEIDELLIKRNVIKNRISSLKIKDFKDQFSFLKDVEDEASLEGFLFPDTYFFQREMDEREVALIFLRNFEKKISPFLKEIEKKNKTLFEILTMASMLEKEMAGKENKKIAAGLLWKRLEHNMLLQVDATVNYALKRDKERISLKDIKIDSPYNTYKYKGLPKGPICNPSLDSIEAALFPEESDFWFYLTTKDGLVIFSKTYEEHLKNKELYLKNQND